RGTDRVVFTDDAGIFRLTGVAPGSVTLEVFYTGLDPQELKLDLAPGASVTREVALTNVARYGRDTAAVRLDSFVVATSRDTEGEALATNEQRFAPNLKAVISTDSFGDMAEGNVGEFLKFLPGITGDHDDAQINTVSLRGFSTNLHGARRRRPARQRQLQRQLPHLPVLPARDQQRVPHRGRQGTHPRDARRLGVRLDQHGEQERV
ncbi:MAG: hypothetical protein ACKPB0_19290, partial [Opitutaceae bacterium]